MIGEIDKKWKELGKVVIGVDEAGRGPLCGPVVVSAVCLKEEILGLNDSKKLTEKRRLELVPEIIDKSIWAVFSVRPEIIDRLNILHATMWGMKRCIERVLRTVKDESIILIDGNRVTGAFENEEYLIKGDSKSINIAAASILAKSHRDRLMNRWAEIFPEYHLESHKGYGTKEHYDILEKVEPCRIYRKSFKLKREKHPEQIKLF